MVCPYCAHNKTAVLSTVKSTTNERFRRCLKCGKTFQTIEAVRFDDYWKEYAKATLDIKEKKQ
jgi:transcriptional repressor NrdR